MNNTKKNFSGAINYIIREYDKMVIEIYRYKKLAENGQKTLKNAKFDEKEQKNEKEVKNAKKT